MNIFNDDYNKKRDVTDAVPNRGFKRYLFILSNHFFRLMSLNLLFLLFCLPIFTIPASLCALTKVLMILYHTGTCSPYQDFWSEFKQKFLGRLLAVFLLFFFPLSASYWFFILGYSSFGVGVGILLFPVCYLTLSYFIALSVSSKSTTTENVIKAFFLVFRNWRESLKLLLVPILLYILSIYYLSYTVILVIFILFSAGQLALCAILEKNIDASLF